VTGPRALAEDVLPIDTAPIPEPAPALPLDGALQPAVPTAVPIEAPAGTTDPRSLEERVTKLEKQLAEIVNALKRDPELANARAERAQAEAQEKAAEIEKLQMMRRDRLEAEGAIAAKGLQLQMIQGVDGDGIGLTGDVDDSRAIEQIFFPPEVMRYLGVQLANQ